MMRTTEILNLLYGEFIQKHPEFSDTQFVLSPSKVTYLRQIVLANYQTLALCNAGRDNYNFINVCNNEFSHLLRDTVSTKEFFESMHNDDLNHFLKVWQFAFQFMEKFTTLELLNFSLILECRMLSSNNEYCRIIFKYMIVMEDDGMRRAQPLLFMKAIDGGKNNEPAHGFYIVDMSYRKFVYATKGYNVSQREIEVIRLSQKGLTSKEIAEKLGIKTSTVNNHRINVLNKLSVSNNSHAAMYLHFMGVM